MPGGGLEVSARVEWLLVLACPDNSVGLCFIRCALRRASFRQFKSGETLCLI